MGSVGIHVHQESSFLYGPVEDMVGMFDIKVSATAENGGAPEQPKGLAFVDSDGESHVYILSESGRQKLVAQLTGGIVLPT